MPRRRRRMASQDRTSFYTYRPTYHRRDSRRTPLPRSNGPADKLLPRHVHRCWGRRPASRYTRDGPPNNLGPSDRCRRHRRSQVEILRHSAPLRHSLGLDCTDGGRARASKSTPRHIPADPEREKRLHRQHPLAPSPPVRSGTPSPKAKSVGSFDRADNLPCWDRTQTSRSRRLRPSASRPCRSGNPSHARTRGASRMGLPGYAALPVPRAEAMKGPTPAPGYPVRPGRGSGRGTRRVPPREPRRVPTHPARLFASSGFRSPDQGSVPIQRHVAPVHVRSIILVVRVVVKLVEVGPVGLAHTRLDLSGRAQGKQRAGSGGE